MDIDLETSEALYEKLLQLESEVKKKLKEKEKESHCVLSSAARPGSSWYILYCMHTDWQTSLKKTLLCLIQQHASLNSQHKMMQKKLKWLYKHSKFDFHLYCLYQASVIGKNQIYVQHLVMGWENIYSKTEHCLFWSTASFQCIHSVKYDIIWGEPNAFIKYAGMDELSSCSTYAVQEGLFPMWLLIPRSSRQNAVQSDSRLSVSSKKFI